MKVCKTCKVIKPLESFSVMRRAKDGKQNECKTCQSVTKAKWKKDNAEKHNASNRASYLRNREATRAKHKQWKKHNPSLVNASKAKRRATKLSATPSWLTDEHHTQIAYTYWLAKDLESISGESYHVDHIVPLQGKNVCGLHVPWNLQVLPATENLKKSNTHND